MCVCVCVCVCMTQLCSCNSRNNHAVLAHETLLDQDNVFTVKACTRRVVLLFSIYSMTIG